MISKRVKLDADPQFDQRLEEIIKLVKEFGDFAGKQMRKVTGAIAVQVLRQHLDRNGVSVSDHDVFIKGIPIELDLVVPRREAELECGILYRPQDVAAVLEVKYSGIYSKESLAAIKKNFDYIREKHQHICCTCVVVLERESFPNKATEANLGHPVHTLHWWSGRRENAKQTGEWETLLTRLQGAYQKLDN